jgi:hypothetical protein
VQAADPVDMLYWQLCFSGCLTIVDAKMLHAKSIARNSSRAVFHDVPEAARDRFLQLLYNAEVTGTQFQFQHKPAFGLLFALRIAFVSLLLPFEEVKPRT